MLLLCPVVSVVGQGRQGDLSPFCLTRAEILPPFAGYVVRLILPEVVESPLDRRVVSSFSYSTVCERTLRTWGGVSQGARGPEGPVDAFKSGARVGGNKVPAGESFLPVGLLGKGDEVPRLVDSSLTGIRVERPLLLRGNAESSCTLDLGGPVSAFPHLEPTATAWPGGRGLRHPR